MRLVLLVALCMVSIAMQAEEWKKNYQVTGKPDILVTAGIDIDVDVRAWDNASVEAKVVADIGHVTVDQVRGKVQVSPGSTTKSFVITTISGAPHIERQ